MSDNNDERLDFAWGFAIGCVATLAALAIGQALGQCTLMMR